VNAGGLGGDEQCLADLPVGPALGDQCQYLNLSSGQAKRAAGEEGVSGDAVVSTGSSSRRRPRWASSSISRRSGIASSSTAVWWAGRSAATA
jgi:hypothetical protein